MLRSFSRPRVSNDNPCSESLFRTVKYRPDYSSRPFASKDEACEWVAHLWTGTTTGTAAASNSSRPIGATAEHYNLSAALRGLRERPPGKSITLESKQPLLASTREVWINKPSEEPKAIQALSLIQAARVAAEGAPSLKVTVFGCLSLS